MVLNLHVKTRTSTTAIVDHCCALYQFMHPRLACISSVKQEKRYHVYRSNPPYCSNKACLGRGRQKSVPPYSIEDDTLAFNVDDVNLQLPGEIKYGAIV